MGRDEMSPLTGATVLARPRLVIVLCQPPTLHPYMRRNARWIARYGSLVSALTANVTLEVKWVTSIESPGDTDTAKQARIARLNKMPGWLSGCWALGAAHSVLWARSAVMVHDSWLMPGVQHLSIYPPTPGGGAACGPLRWRRTWAGVLTWTRASRPKGPPGFGRNRHTCRPRC